MVHRTRAVRLMAASALFAAAPALAGACRDVVVGDGVDAASELCDFVRRCYGEENVYGGCDRFAAKLEGAPQATRQSFLRGLDLEACLTSCPAALACLDADPYCAADGACDANTDCCGWSAALSSCESGRCCVPLGVACAGEGECCEGGCVEGVCGGRPCVPIGETCEAGDECCTGVCREGACDKKDCSFDGEPCALPTDCCPPAPGTTNTCVMGACKTVGVEVCQDEFMPCDPEQVELVCCDGLVCEGEEGGAVCRNEGCAGIGQDCALTPCCGDALCDASTDPPLCVPPVVCSNNGLACAQDFDCCSGFCQKAQPELPDGVCADCLGTTCDHDVCTPGDPLVPDQCDIDSYDCVALVTAYDSYCRCVSWDSLCVSHVDTTCIGTACPF